MQLDVAQVKIARPIAKLSTHNKVQILNFSKAIGNAYVRITYANFCLLKQKFCVFVMSKDISKRYNKLKGRFSVFISNLSKRGHYISLEGKLNTPSIVES